jgi:hypothetical protein
MEPLLPLGLLEGIPDELLLRSGAAAAVAAIAGLLLVLPLFLGHRREIKRLLAWREREPDRGTTEFRAVAAPRTGGALSPAARVTADRPALERITAERAAIAEPSLWRRVIARGPRHPLVLSGAALLAAVAVVAVAAILLADPGGESADGSGLDRAEVQVVVLNGSSQAGLAQSVADSIGAAEFSVAGTGPTGSSRQTVVLFERGRRREARAVARSLNVDVVQPFNQEARAAAAGADVVVIAGEDRA